jgi:hypothetical protein
MRENEEIDFVFIDDAKRPYRVMMYCGTPWLFYWHPDNKWVTLREVTQSEIWDFGQNKLDPEQASLYELTSNIGVHRTAHESTQEPGK